MRPNAFAVLLLVACTGEIAAPIKGSPEAPVDPSLPEPSPQQPPCDAQVVGHQGVHRLSRVEYENALRDLFHHETGAAKDLPADPYTAFFSNIAASLGVDPALAQLYFDAAQVAVDDAFAHARSEVVTCDLGAQGRACAESVVRAFARRAYRRPVPADELQRLLGLYDQASSTWPGAAAARNEEGLKAALQGVLVSDRFLFRVVEVPSDDPGRIEPLDDFELASRLSFFLWGTIPDEVLLAAAEAGALRGGLDAQVERMLLDPKARHLVDGFAAQWLKLERLPFAQPDATAYPGFDEPLRADMMAETKALLNDVIARDESPLTLLTATHSYVTPRLAAHYGLPGVSGEGLTRVSLEGTGRTGMLTHASLLTVNARPNESSIVQRGLWTLDRLLCVTVGAPPPDVQTSLPLDGASSNPRQSLEAHIANPACASCHQVIDPAGLGLENFDGVGQHRTRYKNGDTVDASGKFPGGAAFTNAVELSAALAQHPGFPRCTARNLTTFALGRVLSDSDRCAADTLGRATVVASGRFSDVVKGLVHSAQFLNQKGDL